MRSWFARSVEPVSDVDDGDEAFRDLGLGRPPGELHLDVDAALGEEAPRGADELGRDAAAA